MSDPEQRRPIAATPLRLLSVGPAENVHGGAPEVLVWTEDVMTGRTVRLTFDPVGAAELAAEILRTLTGMGLIDEDEDDDPCND